MSTHEEKTLDDDFSDIDKILLEKQKKAEYKKMKTLDERVEKLEQWVDFWEFYVNSGWAEYRGKIQSIPREEHEKVVNHVLTLKNNLFLQKKEVKRVLEGIKSEIHKRQIGSGDYQLGELRILKEAIKKLGV